jgi:hypothetical protein
VLFVVALIALSGASVALGAALGDDGSGAGSRKIAPRADGSLTVDPKPLTLADVRDMPEGSAQRTVMELFFWSQWGSAPNIVAAYSPAVVGFVGVLNLAGAYAGKRASLLASLPRIINTVPTRLGSTVNVELLRRNLPPERQSFALQREGGRWRIVFDTLLEDGLAAYVQGVDTPAFARLPPNRAVQAGARAVRDYRREALTAIGVTSRRP